MLSDEWGPDLKFHNYQNMLEKNGSIFLFFCSTSKISLSKKIHFSLLINPPLNHGVVHDVGKWKGTWRLIDLYRKMPVLPTFMSYPGWGVIVIVVRERRKKREAIENHCRPDLQPFVLLRKEQLYIQKLDPIFTFVNFGINAVKLTVNLRYIRIKHSPPTPQLLCSSFESRRCSIQLFIHFCAT